MDYREHKDFRTSVRALYQKGGLFQKASDQVQVIFGRIAMSEPDPFQGFKLTKWGETRISKCLKYDLTGYARLITIKDRSITLFCFAGDHETCDAWLDRNRGFTLVADDHGRLGEVRMTTVGGHSAAKPSGQSALTTGKLFGGLQPESYFDRLAEGLPRQIVRQMENLESIDDEQAIFQIAERIDDIKRSAAIYDVFILLRQDKRKEALDRAKVFLGEAREIEELTEEQIKALADSETIKLLRADDPRFQKVFEHFVRSASYMDWMLFLHPDQQAVVARDFANPAKLVGVSGSGKTCIVVKRAVRLAEQHPGERILVLTLNRQLARLIDDMMTAACLQEVRERIDVQPFFSLCQQLLSQFEPENKKLYDDVTWKSKEHIDEIWREYYRCELNNYDARVLVSLHDSLIARGVDAEQYIREEFDWIRSAVAPSDRGRYLDIDRRSRSHALAKEYRSLLLEGLSFWEKKMRAIGVTDYLGLATAVHAYFDRLKPMYRCILVDESQDFGTTEYQLIRKLVHSGQNDLFFCGDAAQQVSAKHRSFSEARINIPSRNSLTVRKNYRNSREILRAAFDVFTNNLCDEMDVMLESGDFEVLDPEYANFSAAPPLMLRADNLEEEIGFALAYLQEYHGYAPTHKACLAFCGFSLYEIQTFGKNLDLSVLDGTITIETDNLFISDLEHTKGFEFDTMIVVNCNKGVIPDPRKPEQERFRDIARFYVAMTRAKNQLIVSHSRDRSTLLENAETNFLPEEWATQVDKAQIPRRGVPPSLDDIRKGQQVGQGMKELLDMSGPEFLYTEHARGLSSLMIEKLRNVVPGRKTIQNRVPVAWATLRDARADCASNPRSRGAFGQDATYQQFRELVDSLAR